MASDHAEKRSSESVEEGGERRNFIEQIVEEDLESGRYGGRLHTRFPPEPNGYLHIGHAKAFLLDFGLAERYGGECNLRFDDTNPLKESEEYVRAIVEDLRWLGVDWEDRLYFASDYFARLYELAEKLVEKGLAYVDDQSLEEIRAGRGSRTQPGVGSPYRERPVAENLDLLRRMRAGEFAAGSRVLRARIDMAAQNLQLRDPVMYRILDARHHRTGDAWCIYPTYDWAHGQSDAIEGITHSLCSLEFQNHRPLYDWYLEHLDFESPPRQIEFARLNISNTVLSKRKLRELVESGRVSGWDDPRMPTLSGMRRRGYTPESIRAFCEEIGIAKFNSVVDVLLLDNALREDLNRRAARAMGVLRPLKLVIENWPEEQEDELEARNNPEDPAAGTRRLPFTRELWVERDDFREEAPRKWFRLAPGREVRLRYAYYVTCTEVVKDPESGAAVELRCSFDPESRGGDTPDGRKVRGTIHWVSARHAVDAEVRLFEPLFLEREPDKLEGDAHFTDNLNPCSLESVQAKLEPSLAAAAPGSRFQLERLGYFCVDSVDSRPDAPVLNRIVALRDSWRKIEKRQAGS